MTHEVEKNGLNWCRREPVSQSEICELDYWQLLSAQRTCGPQLLPTWLVYRLFLRLLLTGVL